MIYAIGEALKALRLSRGYTQEELCYGICSRGNLSKIETGNRIPRWYITEALLHRLGEKPNYAIKFVKREEQEIYASYKYIMYCIMSEVRPEENERKIVESFNSSSILIMQFKQMINLLSAKQNVQHPDSVLNALVAVIQMTIPGFVPPQMNKCFLLSYVELSLLYYIGINMYQSGNKEAAWTILLWLKNYVENRIIDLEERVRIYPMLIYRISLWKKLEKQYNEAVRLCNLGIYYCIKFDRINFLERLLCLKSACLKELKNFPEAKKYSVQARTISEVISYYKEFSPESEDRYCFGQHMPYT